MENPDSKVAEESQEPQNIETQEPQDQESQVVEPEITDPPSKPMAKSSLEDTKFSQDPVKDLFTKACGCYQCGEIKPLKTCGGCKVVHYCSPECQRKNWKSHKKQCQQMSGLSTMSEEQRNKSENRMQIVAAPVSSNQNEMGVTLLSTPGHAIVKERVKLAKQSLKEGIIPEMTVYLVDMKLLKTSPHPVRKIAGAELLTRLGWANDLKKVLGGRLNAQVFYDKIEKNVRPLFETDGEYSGSHIKKQMFVSVFVDVEDRLCLGITDTTGTQGIVDTIMRTQCKSYPFP